MGRLVRVILSWLRDRRKMLAAYIITGLLIYAEQIVLELPNADALLNSTIEKSSFKWELQLGRFMLPLYQMLFGYTISPALVTILSIFALSISSLVITEILPFQPKSLKTCTQFLRGQRIISCIPEPLSSLGILANPIVS